MVVEPYAVRIASPTAIPSIRATVTTAEATPKARRPAASTAAVERGVTVSPKPKPKTREVPGDRLDARSSGVHNAIASEAADARQRGRQG